MTRHFQILLLVLSAALPLSAEILPGFSIEPVTTLPGFLTSLVFDQHDRLWFTTVDGTVWRHYQDYSDAIARVETANEGNAALLGMAFAPDGSIVLHYVAPDLRSDLITRLSLETGEETILARFVCSDQSPCSSEHHGGNPIVTADGTIYVGIGDMAVPMYASSDEHPAGKIFRIPEGGEAEIFAIGFRNPFDLGWDPDYEMLIVGDNGPVGHDEITFVREGEHHGWPHTVGTMPPVEGTVAPVYVFPEIVAPTGLLLPKREGYFAGGVLVCTFVTRAIHFFPGYGADWIADPIEVVRGETAQVIDIAQRSDGEIFFATAFAIYRLIQPLRGDVNGDGVVNSRDLADLEQKLQRGEGGSVYLAHKGTFAVTWGADVNRDGVIDENDLVELRRMLNPRRRAVERRSGRAIHDTGLAAIHD
jgi:glucose/arabinose dehydrogenase